MIPEILVSLLSVAGFGVGLWWTNIVAVARGSIAAAMDGVNTMLDRELDDEAKEKAVRKAGFALFGTAFGIFWRFALALALAYLPLALADLAGFVRADDVLALMMRVDYIVIVSVAAIALSAMVSRRRQTSAAPARNKTQYSAVDRFFHNLAFASPGAQKLASAVEDRVISVPQFEVLNRPVFVTSLARGGTTAILNALHALPDVATHTYRDMPFLTVPVLSRRLSGRRSVVRRERAHGDGMSIDLDSPEAFEEVLWKLYWPEKFETNKIALWTAEERRAEFDAFFIRHMAKLLKAQEVSRETGRYCSKNNANIARIGYLREIFPEARIVVPLRQPDCHAASLLRQHRNFLALQSEDAFVRRYMRDIGHFEFGQIHKVIAFAGFDPARFDPNTGDYWLAYWIAAFREVFSHKGDCIIVRQDDLRRAPQDTMDALCAALGLATHDLDFSSYFRPGEDTTDDSLFDPDLLVQARGLYARLGETQTDGRAAFNAYGS